LAGKTNHTKDDIVALTIRLISQHGYQQISLRRLLGDLHLTTGSFYKHFKNKDDLFKTVTEVISATLGRQAQQQVVKLHLTPFDSLVSLGTFLVNQFATQPYLMDFLFFNPTAINLYQAVETGHHFILLDYTRQLIEEIASQFCLSESSDTLFIKVWSFIQGYGILVRNHATVYDDALLRSAAKELIGVEK
jgi:AcrR family transcriptional regulator